MAFTPSLIGTATTPSGGATSLSIHVSGNVPAGNKIYCPVCINRSGFSDLLDSSGTNVYNQIGGSSNGAFVGLFQVDNNARLQNNDSITLTWTAPFLASMGAFLVTGLTSGSVTNVSSGFGFDRSPDAALNGVPVNSWALGVVGWDGPSTDGYTQAASFNDPGSFNNQVTTGFTVKAGFKQVTTAGQVIFNPSIGVARNWIALLASIAP